MYQHLKAIGMPIILYLGAVLIQRIGSGLASIFTNDLVTQKLAENLAGVVYVLAVISLLNMWKNIYWLSNAAIKKWYLFLLPIAYIFLNANEFYPHSSQDIALSAMSTLSTGLMEELLCRGLVLALIIKAYKRMGQKYYLLNAVLMSSFLFGVAHLTNAIGNGHALGAVVGQVFFATFIAVGFCAVYLHTKSILPLIVIHAGINFVSFLTDSPNAVKTATFLETLPAIIVCAPLFVFGVLLMYKKQQAHLNLQFD